MRSTTLTTMILTAPLSLVLLGGTALAAPGGGQSGIASAAAKAEAVVGSEPAAKVEPAAKAEAAVKAEPAAKAAPAARPAAVRVERQAPTAGSLPVQPFSNADQHTGGANAGGTTAGCGAYCSTTDGSPSRNGNGSGSSSRPCAGCVGKADNKDPRGQAPSGADANNGYECDRNAGVGRSNPAHSGCTTAPVTAPVTAPLTAPVAAPQPAAPRPAAPEPVSGPARPAAPAAPAGLPQVSPVTPVVPPAPVVAPVVPPLVPGAPVVSEPLPGVVVLPAAPARPVGAPACPAGPMAGPPVGGTVAGCPAHPAAGPEHPPVAGVTEAAGETGDAADVPSGGRAVTTLAAPADAAGVVVAAPARASALPFTGAGTGTGLVLGTALVLVGGVLLASGSRGLARA